MVQEKMNRETLEAYIVKTYPHEKNSPWEKYPRHVVFRHKENRKWFALVMDVPKDKLGLPGKESMDVLNVKCDPMLIGSFRRKEGFFPAYHMSKEHWITIALDDTVTDEDVKLLLDMSYQATAPKAKKKRE